MYLRIGSAVEGGDCFCVYFIAIELETRDSEGKSLGDISTNSDNLIIEIIGIGYERGRDMPYDCRSGECFRRRYFQPLIGLENYSVVGDEAGSWAENLLLPKLIVDFYGSIGMLGAHLVYRGHIEGIFHRYFQMYRPHIDRILAIEHTRLFLRKDDISRNGFDAEFRSDRDKGFRYRKIEYESQERERGDKPYDQKKHIGIPSDLLVFIDLCFFLSEEHESGQELIHLIAGIFQKSEIMPEDMIFGVLLLELYIVIFLEKSDSEGLTELSELTIVGYKREPFHRETVEEKLQIQVIHEVDIILDLYLDLRRIHLGYLLKYLYEGIVFMDRESFFIHIDRLCSGVCGL